MRVAIYYAPELDDPALGSGVFVVGAGSGARGGGAQPALDGIAEVTAAARGYGFHCTLKPPMRLATSYGAFRDEVSAMVQSLRAFDMPTLAVADLSGFLAVRETELSPALQALADGCVAWRRIGIGRRRTRRSWRGGGARGWRRMRTSCCCGGGYPGVFGRWRFHMTLTRRFDAGRLQDQAGWRAAAEAHFAAALARKRRVESICLFTQAGPGVPFLLAERVPLAASG